MSTFENTHWRCQPALAVLIVLSALGFLAIAHFEKHSKLELDTNT